MNINSEYLLKKLTDILAIDSPSGDCIEVINYLNKNFKDLGLTTKISPKGALTVIIKGRDVENPVAVTAHVDTLRAMVKEIKPNGRLKLTQIGGYPWPTIDGEYCTISSLDGKKYRGTILFDKTSCHIYGDIPRTMIRNEENIEVRIDELVFSKKDTTKLGIEVGDYVYFDKRTEIRKNGFIKSRHLDDKACVAILLEVARNIVENNNIPSKTTYFIISNYEEVGHGGAGLINNKIKEVIAVDMATPGIGQQSKEQEVTICAKESTGPYDLELKKKLIKIGKEKNLNYNIDVFKYYNSDARVALVAGGQFKHALIGPGVDASHAYERTHIQGLENTVKLLIAYLNS